MRMSAQFYQFQINSSTPFAPIALPFSYLYSSTEMISVWNQGPEPVYAGRVLKSSPTVVTYTSNQVLTIPAGQTVLIPADTSADPWKLGFNTPSTSGTTDIMITLCD
jgi:hypothetical protein